MKQTAVRLLPHGSVNTDTYYSLTNEMLYNFKGLFQGHYGRSWSNFNNLPVKTLKSINVAIVAMEHYKCGYCGWLIEQHCEDYLQHHCFANKTKLGEPLQLMSDENNILTMYVPDDLAAAGASEAHGCMEETLISEVMTRRPLWDHSTSRAERHQAKLKDLWNEIFNIFEGKFDVEYLKKKWRQLRDEYMRARKKEKTYIPSGSGADAHGFKTKFKFYALMTFLSDSLEVHPTQSNITEDLLSPSSTSSASASSNTESCLGKKRKNTSEEVEREILQVLREPIQQPDGVDGFLLMLGEGCRRLPYPNRSRLQIKILTMLQNELDNI
ncbi:hypothetical protein RI129_007119 [Pyrocoelia pectoralis]|uniref:MADF domain-containing protein n=1 Tax=Pyrocoelia pectoralis TaxID=417401 RepID=A0AAN7VFZ8_9COLE